MAFSGTLFKDRPIPFEREAAVESAMSGMKNGLTKSWRKTAARALRPEEIVDKEALQTQATKRPANPGIEDENMSMT